MDLSIPPILCANPSPLYGKKSDIYSYIISESDQTIRLISNPHFTCMGSLQACIHVGHISASTQVVVRQF